MPSTLRQAAATIRWYLLFRETYTPLIDNSSLNDTKTGFNGTGLFLVERGKTHKVLIVNFINVGKGFCEGMELAGGSLASESGNMKRIYNTNDH